MAYDDRFSKQAAQYARYRPHYPTALYEYLISVTQERHLAWDCGTGNGQVALKLADYFDSIIATDVNENQIQHAFLHPKVSYKVARAENSKLSSNSFDLVTVGNALHWFELDIFYEEVRRVLKPGGIIAVFQYGFQRLGPEIDDILLPFETEFLKDYWADRNQIAMKGYGTLPFPFERLVTPGIQMSLEWSLDDIHGFVSSWSAVQKYKDKHNKDPYDQIAKELTERWGDINQMKEVSWDLELRVGRIAL